METETRSSESLALRSALQELSDMQSKFNVQNQKASDLLQKKRDLLAAINGVNPLADKKNSVTDAWIRGEATQAQYDAAWRAHNDAVLAAAKAKDMVAAVDNALAGINSERGSLQQEIASQRGRIERLYLDSLMEGLKGDAELTERLNKAFTFYQNRRGGRVFVTHPDYSKIVGQTARSFLQDIGIIGNDNANIWQEIDAIKD